MGTNIRPEISERNPYWINKHRYYELKHFCLQYNGWASAYKALDGKTARPLLDGRASGGAGDPTEKCAERRVYYADRMAMVRQAALDATADFHEQLLLAVTEGLSYEHIRARTNIPCSKDEWYECYRRFFWLLSKARE